MESTIGLYKTELIKRRGPWRTLADVELGTAQWIEWYNARRLSPRFGLHTPASVHFGTAEKIRVDRAQVLAAAYARNPERFSRRPEPPKLPTGAWINPPDEHTRLQNN